MRRQGLQDPPRHLIVRLAFGQQPIVLDLVHRFGGGVPIAPVRRRTDQVRLGFAVLARPADLDRIAVAVQGGGLEIQEDVHGHDDAWRLPRFPSDKLESQA